MNTEATLQQIHQLVEDYNNRRLSMADYRLRRRELLADIDARINGIERADIPKSDLITVRKQH